MYQYVTAVASGITGLWNMLRGSLLQGRGFRHNTEAYWQKSYSSVVLSGFSCTAAILLLLLSYELSAGYFPDTAAGCVSLLTALGAVVMLVLQIRQEIISARYKRLDCECRLLRRENRILEQKVSDLVTNSAIARAAASSMTFDCFIGSVARMLRKNRSARELVIYTCHDGGILPHTYYQLSECSELCLSFSRTDMQRCVEEDKNEVTLNNSGFSADNLALEYVGGNITIEGDLLYSENNAGRLRITIFECSEKSYSFQDLLENMVQNALTSVEISYEGVFKALGYTCPVLTEVSNSSGVLMQRLEVEESILGVVRLQFSEHSGSSLKSMKTILQNTSGHISKALYNQRMYELAIRDGLTRLYNKRYLMEVLEANCSSCVSGIEKLSFMLIDIDFFKKVNDTWGHLAGDEVLRRIAAVVEQAARETDIVCRYGGEELAVLMPHTDIDGAGVLAERIRIQVAEEVFVSESNEEFSVTASFGVAEMQSGMTSPEELIAYADQALYRAKNTGRNRVEIRQVAAGAAAAA